MIQPREVAGSL